MLMPHEREIKIQSYISKTIVCGLFDLQVAFSEVVNSVFHKSGRYVSS
jgi:hypothetical protein